MAFLISSSLAFLGLLVISQAADPTCEDLTKPVELEDERSIIGKWVFQEGITNSPRLGNVFKTMNSSWMEFTPSSLTDTLVLSQGSLIHGGCQLTSKNVTFQNSTIHVSVHNITTVINLLPSCAHCLTLSFCREMADETLRSIYFLTKEPKAPETAVELYRKQAACLGLKEEPQFSYDGVTELCGKTDTCESQTKPEPEKNAT
ncbi:alpha-1-acid glycoprotein 1-like [Salminus brasiliensis]|uniref:alpha-1-acid glycoprotein 1-like n=1 Tax=Salminus brasiliensis TaxID=930266 RepID=UPI003B8333C5